LDAREGSLVSAWAATDDDDVVFFLGFAHLSILAVSSGAWVTKWQSFREMEPSVVARVAVRNRLKT
jgi:hypothetical protein